MHGEKAIENTSKHARVESNKELPKSGVNGQSLGIINATFPSTVLGHLDKGRFLKEKTFRPRKRSITFLLPPD